MTDFLMLAFIFLVAGVISVPIASRLGLGSVLGYLIAGIVISPILALLNVDVVSIQHFAEFGVVMMLFLVGLELEPKHLWSMRGQLMGLGGGQVLLSTLAVMGVAMVFGQSWTIALAVGLVLALSSTAIVLQTLNEKGLMKSDGGQSSFSVLLTQDIAVIPILALIPLLAMPDLMDSASAVAEGHGATEIHATDTGHGDGHDDGHGDDHGDDGHGSSMSLVDGLNGWQTALVNIAAIAAVILGGNYLTRPLFRFIAVAGLRELFVATALMGVVGIALLMTLVGLSPALGTFLAGVVLANSEYRHELESDIDPFRGLLLGLFFMTVGAGINFALLFDNLGLVIGLTIGLMVIKGLILFVLGTVFGLRGTDRWLLTLGLAQAGEFGFVLLSFTVASSVIPQSVADQLLLVIALSMLLTPALFIFYDRVIAPRFVGAESDREEDEIEEQGSVIIAGYGRMGTVIDRMMDAAGFSTTVIDYSSQQIDNLRKFGASAYYGDATRPDLLAAAGIAKAKILVIVIDDEEKITELTKYAISNYPNLHVIARARTRHHVYHLWAVGCRDIIRETYDSALRIGRSAYEAMGVPKERAETMAEMFNQTDRRSMVALADVYDLEIPPSENDAYIAAVLEIRDEWQLQLSRRVMAIKDGANPDDLDDDGKVRPSEA
ncbi:MAG: potassium transporter [Boseongicola sp.]|nr:cation:proton antiporter [Boseongicola sp.]NNL18035.1 potassium transporter [Boseongicola sp.]